MLRSWALVICIALGVAIAFATAAPPSPMPAGAPASAASAERAMADVRAITRAPHPIGSAENARVRDYVSGRLMGLGLEVSLHSALAAETREDLLNVGRVQNVIGVLPGRDRSLPAVAVMSHYDSVPGSPGAADDAAGVAASLEAIRALRVRGQPLRDVVVIVTDGEEAGLFGARAFWSGHPLASRIGAVINLEARGSSGPAFMFETGRGNGETVRRFAAAVDAPNANSVMSWVYDRMPNGSDFTLPKDKGVQGINIAFIGTPFDYHSASATPDNLDRRSLQHMSDQTLAVLDSLARAGTLPAKAPNLTYSDLLGRVLVVYPTWAGWLFVLAAAGLLGVALWRGRRDLRPLDLLRGAAGFVLVLTATALILRLLYRVAPVGPEFYQSQTVAQFGLFFLGMALAGAGVALTAFIDVARGGRRWIVAAVLLVAGLMCAVFGGFDPVGLGLGVAAAALAAWLLGRPTPAAPLWGGMLLAGLALAVLLQALAPETAFFLAWPLLLAASLAAFGGLAQERRAALVATVLLGALAFAWLGRFAAFLFDGLGLTSPELLGLFAAMLGMVLAPLVAAFAGWRWSRGAAGALLAAGCAVLVVVALRDPASARTPTPAAILHVTSAEGGSRLVSARAELDSWSRKALGATPTAGAQPDLFLKRGWSAPTAASPPRPVSLVLGDAAGGRVLRVGANGAREVQLELKGAAPFTLSIGGESLRVAAGEPVRVRLHAPRTEMLRIVGGGQIEATYAAVHDGWPAGAAPLPPMPGDVMPWRNHGSTVMTGRVVLR